MNLLNKLSLCMAKIGCAGLRNASDYNKDNLDYVKAVVKNQDTRSFQFASKYIRSDAESLLEMVKIDPEILDYVEKTIFDRYCEDMVVIEDEVVDKIIFALKCLEINIVCFAHFDEETKLKLVDLFNNEKSYNGKFGGKPCVVDLNKFTSNEDLMFLIDYFKTCKKSNI